MLALHRGAQVAAEQLLRGPAVEEYARDAGMAQQESAQVVGLDRSALDRRIQAATAAA